MPGDCSEAARGEALWGAAGEAVGALGRHGSRLTLTKSGQEVPPQRLPHHPEGRDPPAHRAAGSFRAGLARPAGHRLRRVAPRRPASALPPAYVSLDTETWARVRRYGTEDAWASFHWQIWRPTPCFKPTFIPISPATAPARC